MMSFLGDKHVLELAWLQLWQSSLLIAIVWLLSRTLLRQRPRVARALWRLSCSNASCHHSFPVRWACSAGAR